jgi:hypothetical protein
MKRLVVKLCLLVTICMAAGCGIFKSGCQCPKVSYNAYPKR